MLKLSTIPRFQRFTFALLAGLGMILAACAPDDSPTVTIAVETPVAPATTLPPVAPPTETAPAVAPSETSVPAEATSPAAGNVLRLVLAADGNEARYLVREQLANLSFPSDAVGATSAITGLIVIAEDGALVPEESKFVVDLTTLQSDSNLRDNFIQRNTLQTNTYPTAEFAPTQAIGLPSPLPTSGPVAFQLVGGLTVHGVTNQSTWEVTAEIVDGRELVGRASTSFTFGDYGMTVPRVARVLSIEETIRLEFDFHLALEPSGSP